MPPTGPPSRNSSRARTQCCPRSGRAARRPRTASQRRAEHRGRHDEGRRPAAGLRIRRWRLHPGRPGQRGAGEDDPAQGAGQAFRRRPRDGSGYLRQRPRLDAGAGDPARQLRTDWPVPGPAGVSAEWRREDLAEQMSRTSWQARADTEQLLGASTSTAGAEPDCTARRAMASACAAIKSRYQANEDFGVRRCVSKSTCTKPNRWWYPSAHSKLSISVQTR